MSRGKRTSLRRIYFLIGYMFLKSYINIQKNIQNVYEKNMNKKVVSCTWNVTSPLAFVVAGKVLQLSALLPTNDTVRRLLLQRRITLARVTNRYRWRLLRVIYRWQLFIDSADRFGAWNLTFVVCAPTNPYIIVAIVKTMRRGAPCWSRANAALVRDFNT